MRHEVLDQSAGLTRDGWRKRYTVSPPSMSPQEPAIANHLIRHEVHHQVSRRRVALVARNQFPKISKLVQDRSADAATVSFKDAATSTGRCCRSSRDNEPSRCEEPGRKERPRTADNQKKSAVPVLFAPPWFPAALPAVRSIRASSTLSPYSLHPSGSFEPPSRTPSTFPDALCWLVEGVNPQLETP